MPEKVKDAQTRQALEGAVTSERLSGSPKLVQLLTFLVEETLAGRSDLLKGYNIAIEVFQRPTDFDPALDPIVRVQMGRLRQALDLYYLTDGAVEPVHIVIPKGTNVPVFKLKTELSGPRPGLVGPTERLHQPQIEIGSVIDPTNFASGNSSTVGPATQRASLGGANFSDRANAWGSVPNAARKWYDQFLGIRTTRHIPVAAALAILLVIVGILMTRRDPDKIITGRIAAQLELPLYRPHIRLFLTSRQQSNNNLNVETSFAREILALLAKYDAFTIEMADTRHVAARTDRNPLIYTLEVEGGVIAADELLSLRLVSDADYTVIWASKFSRAQQPEELDHSLRRISQHVTAQLSHFRGLLFTHMASRTDLSVNVQCVATALQNVIDRKIALDAVTSSKACLSLIRHSPKPNPIAIALLAELHTAPFDTKSPPRQALEIARHAASVAPRNLVVARAMMLASINAGLTDEGLEIGRRALEINPYNPDMNGDYGSQLIIAGRYSEGLKFIDIALTELPPTDPRWVFAQFLGYLGLNQNADAARFGRSLLGQRLPAYAIASVCSAVVLGNLGEAQVQLRALTQIDPSVARDPVSLIRYLRLAPVLERKISDLLEQIRI